MKSQRFQHFSRLPGNSTAGTTFRTTLPHASNLHQFPLRTCPYGIFMFHQIMQSLQRIISLWTWASWMVSFREWSLNVIFITCYLNGPGISHYSPLLIFSCMPSSRCGSHLLKRLKATSRRMRDSNRCTNGRLGTEHMSVTESHCSWVSLVLTHAVCICRVLANLHLEMDI